MLSPSPPSSRSRGSLHKAGELECSDLLVGTGGERFVPASEVGRGEPVTAFLELYAQDGGDFTGITVDFEARDAQSGTLAAGGAGSIGEGTFSNRRLADAQLDLSTSAPGAYVVSAVVKKDGQPLGTIRRAVVTR